MHLPVATGLPTATSHGSAAREFGRIVETPAGESVEADLAAILDQQLPPHEGRWRRGEQIASGRYRILDPGGQQLGDEVWRLWHTEEGGRLLHTIRHRGAATLEIWQREEASGETTFVEITRRQDGRHSRTRHSLIEGILTSTTRGNDTGIVHQTVALPAGASLTTPTVLQAGRSWLQHGTSGTFSVFHLGGAERATGYLDQRHCEALGERPIEIGGDTFSSRLVEFQLAGTVTRWWLDEKLGIPLRGEMPGVGKIVLDQLQRSEH